MKDTLGTALSALRLTQLQAWRDFCARQYHRGSPPGRDVWHALTAAAADALDDLEEQAEAFDRMLDEIGEQVTGPLDLDGWITE